MGWLTNLIVQNLLKLTPRQQLSLSKCAAAMALSQNLYRRSRPQEDPEIVRK